MSEARAVTLPRRETYRDEMNFAEFPLAALSDSLPKDQKTLVFTDKIYDRARKETVTRQLTITASDQYGLPTAMDDEVLLGLIQLTSKHAFSDRRVHFTRYELIKLLGWRDESKSYDRVEQSLLRWLGVTLYYKKAWWSKEEKCWVDENFHVLDHVTIFDRERRDRRLEAKKDDPLAGMSSFVWNEAVFNSFRAGYIKEIDFELFTTLKSSISKRMYRFLDKRFYQKSRLEFDLRDFACEHIGLSKNYHNGELKRRLMTGIKELEDVSFLEALPATERFIKQRAGEWTLVLKAKTGAERIECEEAVDKELLAALTERGITKKTAVELLSGKEPERIKEKIRYFDWLLERKDKRIVRNPAGFLFKAIRDDYELPADFVSSTRSTLKVEKVREIAKRPQLTDKRKEKVENERALERVRLDALWEAMSEEEQELFEEEALRNADRFFVSQYEKGKEEKGPLFRTVRQAIIHQELRRRMGE